MRRKTQVFIKSKYFIIPILFFLLTICITSLHPSKVYGEQDGYYTYTIEGVLEKYVGENSLSKLTIPKELTDNGVTTAITAIGDECFKSNPTLSEIIIPDTITTIGVQSFANMALLNQITIPSTVTLVGEKAFYDNDLLDVTINADSRAFGNDVFSNCKNLRSVTFGADAKWQQIPSRMFYGSTSLDNISIPEGVSKIGSAAFFDSGLKEVILPSTLRTISEDAFKQSSLESVAFPAGIRKIGKEAFAKSDVKSISWPDSVPIMEDSMFSECGSLNEIILPKNMSSIGEWAFDTGGSVSVYNASGEAIVAGDSARDVGAQYMTGHTTLQTYAAIAIDASLAGKITIEGAAIEKGQNIYYIGEILTKPAAGYTIAGLELNDMPIYPSNERYTFTTPSSASVLMGSVTAVPPNPPDPAAPPDSNPPPPAGDTEDSGGQNTTPPSAQPGGNDQDTSEEQKPKALKKGTKITDKSSKAIYKVTSSSGTLKVEYVSSAEKKPKTIKIPSKIKSQGIWYQVTTIGKKALKGKTKLTKVTLPTTISSIGDDAFNGCKELKTVSIPKNVTKIGKQTFYGAKKLKTVEIKSTILKSVGKNAFKNIDKKAQIKVPKKQYSKYQKLLKGKGILSSMKWKKI